MVKRKGVSIVVDENFFMKFESDRQMQQSELRKSMGKMFNLSQVEFTSILAKKKFEFRFPKSSLPQKPFMRKVIVRRRRVRRRII